MESEGEKLSGAEIGNFVIENKIEIFINFVMGIILLIIPFLVTKRKDESNQPILNNKTSRAEVKIIIRETTKIIYPQRVKVRKEHAEDNEFLIIWALLALFGLMLYQRYHLEIMNFLLMYSILSLLSTSLLIILLYRNNMFYRVNRTWCWLMIWLVFVNFVNLALMSQQDLSLNDEVDAFLRGIYYLQGFVIIALLNLGMIFIQGHIFALNHFITHKGKISGVIVRKTSFLLNAQISFVIIIVVISLLSLALSSGIAFDFINGDL